MTELQAEKQKQKKEDHQIQSTPFRGAIALHFFLPGVAMGPEVIK